MRVIKGRAGATVKPLSGSQIYNLQKRNGFPKLVAEGDSWFDFPFPTSQERKPRRDLVDFLSLKHDFAIKSVAKRGDTLDNMAYNTIDKAIKVIKKEKPVGFIFSGGGNDIAGPELSAFLNHKDSGNSIIRKDMFKLYLNTVIKTSYMNIIDKVLNSKSDIQIFGHGYDYVNPNGKAAFSILWANLSGPWLDPVFQSKGIPKSEMQLRKDTLKWFVDQFNDLLLEIDHEIDNYNYVNFRGTINSNGWHDEIHPKKDGFEKLSNIMAATIKKTLSID